MIEVKFNKSNSNPFFGLKNCLELLNTNKQITSQMLDAAWMEVKDSKEKREMFFSLLFSIGDITNRQHNIFKNKKVDTGGNANRENFEVVLQWLWNNNREQFMRFLFAHLFNEFTSFDVLFKNRVKTVKGTNKVKSISSVFIRK